jgi:O-antigen/teichoic acid export membrane protein
LVTLAIKANALAVLPAALVLVAGSSVIMGLYGPGFRGGWPTLIAVVITAAVLAIQSPAIQGIIAAGRMWPVFFMNLGWAVSFFALTAALLSRGALGLAGARLGAYVLNGIWVFWFAGRCVSEPRIREVAQSTSSGGE